MTRRIRSRGTNALDPRDLVHPLPLHGRAQLREQVAARITAEVRALREEARRLRVDRTRLERTNRELVQKNQIWTLGTAGSGFLAILLISMNIGRSGEEAPLVGEGMLAVDPIYAEYGVESTPHLVPTIEATPELAYEAPNLNLVPTLEPAAAAIVPTPEPVATVPAATTTSSVAANSYTPKVNLPTTYTVGQGDNIGKIAQKMYGKYSLWPHIRDANSETLGGSIDLQIGMELNIPEL